MKFQKTVRLRDGRSCILRNAAEADAEVMLELFIKTHEETDFLLSYPDEITLTADDERSFLSELDKSDNSVEIIALIDGKTVGSAGFSPVGGAEKLRHRAEFGISVLKDYQGNGIGKELTLAAIECAKTAGYTQLELDVETKNKTAISLYKSCGFVEYGKNPRGFNTRESGYCELTLMRAELK